MPVTKNARATAASHIMSAAGLATLLALCSCRQSEPIAAQSNRAPSAAEPQPVRISMEALHAAGGIPPGWRFAPPPGNVAHGRAAFVEFGCHDCHAVQGENFPSVTRDERHVGPDLTGMGAHHPAEYFAEAILNPDAVLIDAANYITASGRSLMPSYPDMTLQQLADLVAYLKSLQSTQADHSAHSGMDHSGHAAPAKPATDALSYFAQAYEIDDARIDDFYAWFDRSAYKQIPGLVRIDTYASRIQDGRHTVLCLFGFADDNSLQGFLRQRATLTTAADFIRPVNQPLLETLPLYRAVQMSTP